MNLFPHQSAVVGPVKSAVGWSYPERAALVADIRSILDEDPPDPDLIARIAWGAVAWASVESIQSFIRSVLAEMEPHR